MFGKKKCPKCEEKINGKYDFCPYCGNPVNENLKEDFGMLGKNDFVDEFDSFSKSMFNGFGGNMIPKMFGSMMKMLEKEMEKEIKKKDSRPKTNFQLFINGKKIDLGNVLPVVKQKKQIKEILQKDLPKNKLANFVNLPRENPKTNIRRFSNKIVYEIDVPGVSSVNDISISKLENGIEIKAVSKKKSYLKILPVNFPITGYGIDNQKIILELEVLG